MASTQSKTPKTIHLKDYTPPSHTVSDLNLLFQIFDGHTLVTQTATYTRAAKSRCDLVLNHGQDIEIESLAINGKTTTKYKLDDDFLTIACPGDEFKLEIMTRIKPENNTSLNGLYKSGGTYSTQCEAEGFRNITFCMDRPDVMTTYTVRIEADKKSAPVLLSNGNLIDEGELDGGRHYATWHDPHNKPCYLFALVAGDLVYKEDNFKTMNGRDVTLRIYTRDGDLPQVDFAMQALIDSMKWDEVAYGREYDLDVFNIVAVSDFNMGAMENKGLNIFNTALILAHPDTATDADFLRVERVIGHEYFHNWSGNRVTCRDWFQLSLKEGFTVYRENQFGQDMNDAVTERIDEVSLLRDLQFSEDASPMAHPIRPESYIEINNFYTMTVYEKGGEVIRMLNTLLGDEAYRKGTDLYFSRHDGQAATCDEFLKCMEDVSAHKDLPQFKLWYSQAGTPTVTASEHYDDKKNVLTITFTQTVPDTAGQTNKKPMVIPIMTGLLDDKGHNIAEETLILKKSKQSFTFKDVAKRPTVSYLRGFSAPVILKTPHTPTDLMFLMAHDTDGFNRWDACQKLAMQTIQSYIDDGYEPIDTAYQSALSSMVDTLKDDNKALLVRMLSLPDDSIIAQNQKYIDPDAIARAKDLFEKEVGCAIEHHLNGLYEISAPNAEFSTTPDAMAKRALRNIVLKYMMAVNEGKAIKMAFDQYQNAITMTEKIGALSILVETDRPEREHAVADFYTRYNRHELVLNKWFSIQACADRHDTPARVKELMKHKDFTISNPNRLRSLIGAFAMRNMKGFHVLSGEGYKILTDMILELNDKNPQIAARLLTPMRQWKQYTPDRQKLMKAQLKRILEQDNLSPDVFEIADKCLNA
jgi:aminopeptidase N